MFAHEFISRSFSHGVPPRERERETTCKQAATKIHIKSERFCKRHKQAPSDRRRKSRVRMGKKREKQQQRKKEEKGGNERGRAGCCCSGEECFRCFGNHSGCFSCQSYLVCVDASCEWGEKKEKRVNNFSFRLSLLLALPPPHSISLSFAFL